MPTRRKAREPWQILVVDDDPLALFMTASIVRLALPGMAVITADNAAQALTLFAQNRFDCALIDYDMPEVNGMELARQLRQTDGFLPVLLCTGAGNELLVADAMKQGVSDYLPKSALSADGLRRAISDAIEHARQASIIAAQRQDLQMFAFAMAHDFKQPVRQLVTFSRLARQELPEGLSPRLDKMLAFIGTAASRLDQLVDVLSQFTFLSSPPPPRAVDVGEVLDTVEAGLRQFMAEKHGRLRRQSASLGQIMGNEALLGQVLQNLVINGMSYNQSPQPTVTIASTLCPSTLEITVSDNGIGIEAAYLEEIFQPLFRLPACHESEGSGIGLTLARKAVLAMNGSITCQSQPGQGTTFTLILPLAPATSPPAPPQNAASSAAH